MTRFVIILLCAFAAMLPAKAETPPLDDAAAERLTTYYYVHKDTEQIGPLLAWVEKSHIADKETAAFPIAAFLSGVFAENPDKVRGWVTSVALTGNARGIVERALWLAHRSELISDAMGDRVDYAADDPSSLMKWSLDTPSRFDMMWAMFVATGDVAYPARLIDLLDDSVAFTGDAATNAKYREVAAWSLESNMRQHELILRMVRAEAAKRSGTIREKLDAMLEAVKGERIGMNDCDGEFCATLMLLAEETLKEFDKPSNEAPVLTLLDEAKVGDKVAVKLTFTGMDLADGLTADVTYDIKTITPDGSLYGEDHKDLEALKAKIPVRFSIYDNRAFMMIRFEPKDKRGTYTVEATITDNIGHHRLTLSRAIALKD